MIVGEDQLCPYHHHRSKREDIINRGGGVLLVEVRNATESGELLDTPVVLSIDGRVVEVPSQHTIRLEPGESVTLPSYLHHKFWGETGKGPVLTGEVSAVNDDETDNVFIPEYPRFPGIRPDVEPVHLMCWEYPGAGD